MKSFDETYADHDFKRQMADAKAGWMANIPREAEPDLVVEGLSGSLLGHLVGLFSRGSR
jgi:hypothetical protein